MTHAHFELALGPGDVTLSRGDLEGEQSRGVLRDYLVGVVDLIELVVVVDAGQLLTPTALTLVCLPMEGELILLEISISRGKVEGLQLGVGLLHLSTQG